MARLVKTRARQPYRSRRFSSSLEPVREIVFFVCIFELFVNVVCTFFFSVVLIASVFIVVIRILVFSITEML